MSHSQYLRDLLRPLGIYDLEAPFNGGELDAQGEALDRAMAALEEIQRESSLTTAESWGLEQVARLFLRRPVATQPRPLADALAALLRIGGDSFTLEAINDTILGWLDSLTPEQERFARHYLRLSGHEGLHWGVLRALWASPACLTVVQMQDLLGLGSSARMNTPSTLGGNWQWRARPEAMNARLARRLRQETAIYQRLPRPQGGTVCDKE